MSKKKGTVKKAIAWILSLAIIITAVGGIFAYKKNDKFKSKINNILKIEESVVNPNIEQSTENSEEINSNSSDDILNLKQKLESAEIKMGNISNPNLIYNADFKINQRGTIAVTRNGEDIYTADRWGLFKGNGKFNVSSHRLTGMDETQPTVLCQWVEDSKWFIFGETITVSATIDDVRYSKTITLPETYEEDYINNVYECDRFVFRIYVSKSKSMIGVQFLVVNGADIVIDRVKLEVSNYETKYIERSTSEDLVLCQRYFQKLSVISVGYALKTDKVIFIVNTPNTIKGATKFNFVTSPSIYRDGTRTAVSDITLNQIASNGVMFTLTGSDFVQYDPYFIMGGLLAVEGEFYIDFNI